MLVYCILFLLVFITTKIKSKKIKALIILSALVSVYSLRSIDVGVDISGYVNKFQIISTVDWENLFLPGYAFSHYEKGFILYDKFLSLFIYDGQWFLFATAVIVYGLLLRFFWKQDKEKFANNLYLYMCFPSFFVLLSGMRQALAVSLILTAYTFYKEKKYPIAVVFFIIATFFHISSLIGLLIVLLDRVVFKKKNLWILIFFGIMVFVLRFTIANRVFIALSGFIDKIDAYTIESKNAFGILAFYLLLLVFVFFFSTKKAEQDTNFIISRNALFLLSLLQIFASTSSNLMRITYYIIPFVPCCINGVIDNVFSFEVKGKRRSLYIVFYILFTLFAGYLILKNNSLELVPFKFFWEE